MLTALNGGVERANGWATLRQEVHAAQKVLEARVGAQEVELGCAFHIDIEAPWFVGSSIQPMQHFLLILDEPVLEGDVQSGIRCIEGCSAFLLLLMGFIA